MRDGKATGRTVTHDLVLPFVSFNFGPQPLYPRVTFPVAEPEDIIALSGALQQLVPLGLKVSAGEVRGKLGLSEPEGDDDLLAAPVPPPAPQLSSQGDMPGGAGSGPKGPSPPKSAEVLAAGAAGHGLACRCAGCLSRWPVALTVDPGDFTRDGLDAADALMASALDGWREMADPLLGPLLSAAAKATSFDEALALIAKRGSDGAALLERLAVATAKARGIGDVMD